MTHTAPSARGSGRWNEIRATCDLTLGDNEDATEVSWFMNIQNDSKSRGASSTLIDRPLAGPIVLLAKFTCIYRRRPHNVSTVATPGRKKYPWKNVPPWSLLRRRLQQCSTTALHNSIIDTLHASTNNLGSALTGFEPPSKDSRALVAERPEKSPEIPETSAVSLKDDHSDNGDENHNERTQSITSASVIAGDGDLKVDRRGSFICDRPHNEHDRGSVGTENLQRTNQTESIVSTNNSNEAYLSTAESSEQTLAPIAASPSSLPDVGEGGLEIVDISKLTTAKALDKRSSSPGVEYKCELSTTIKQFFLSF